MAGVDTSAQNGERQVNSDVNMIPFIDLLMVTIAFLLITAVWVTHSRIETNAQVPGTKTGTPLASSDKTLHLHVTDTAFVLSWKHGSTTISETRIARESKTDKKQLAKKIAAEWQLHGGHKDPSDHQLDRCVLHTDNSLAFRQVVEVMDAIYTAKREIAVAGRRQATPVFNVAFAAR